ncbi:transglycosylase SLT domain-containing protein [Pararhodospirillum oryzae]|uniref:Transglycosylase SLT domain-containing protein n=1 Tax=Pararhodospirillum oryzae TaxID=478448 RepID=A0A512H4Z6_9PROT|nr:transglycosylase SLT domain-containing protein [Pararhodospirillum oryzae]GEO80511.1 hypothetical protein ROR02_06420 [Pararhodospirillum oryzae]
MRPSLRSDALRGLGGARPMAALALTGLAFLAPGLARAETPEALCAAHTEAYNRQAGFPPHMLTAISLVESGRWNPTLKARVAWPWTVTSGGAGNFYPTKAEALAAVRALQARGVGNIDVGCMQVNLHFHGSAFDSLEEAMDPASNVAYAVTFLKRLYAETGSWAESVTAYHSRTPVHAERYAGKINEAWTEAETTAPARLRLVAQVTTLGPDITPRPLFSGAGAAAPGFDPSVTPRSLARYQAAAAKNQIFIAKAQAADQAYEARITEARTEKAQDEADKRAFAESWRAQKLKAWEARRAGDPPS